jgi:hypothetical protein
MKSEAGASSVFSPAQRLALLAGLALLLVGRLPRAWAHGRFQDEEGTVFFAYARHFPWQQALFRPFAGYWNFAANAVTLAAAQMARGGVLPLEWVPHFTMTVALAFQLLPAVLILTAKAEWLSSRAAVAASLLLLALTPATEEVYFNVLHIQFHLALCAALILAFDVPERRSTRIFYNVLLFIAPLCGPGPIVILPLFALRALVDRDRGRLVQLASFSAGSAIQMLLFYGPSIMRGHLAGPAETLAGIFVRVIALRAVGPDFADSIAQVISASRAAGTLTWLAFAAVPIIAFGALGADAVRRRDSAVWLLLSGLGIAAASLGFGMIRLSDDELWSPLVSERYNFLPALLIGLTIVVLAMRDGIRRQRFYAFLCAWMLVVGASYYSAVLGYLADGPSWPAEVRAWRADHRHPLAVWPKPWVVDLSDANHQCLPPPTRYGVPTDPRYCESGWVAGFYYQRTAGSPNPNLPPSGHGTTSR